MHTGIYNWNLLQYCAMQLYFPFFPRTDSFATVGATGGGALLLVVIIIILCALIVHCTAKSKLHAQQGGTVCTLNQLSTHCVLNGLHVVPIPEHNTSK